MATRSMKTVVRKSLADTPMELAHTFQVRQHGCDLMPSVPKSPHPTPEPKVPLKDQAESSGQSNRNTRPSSGRLPIITNDMDTGRGTPWVISARTDDGSATRIGVLEGRLQQQERTTQSLLDRAYKIKEDILENMTTQQGTWQEEKHARMLLQEHIRTITEVLRNLSRDISALQTLNNQKDTVLSGTHNEVKQLELNHVAGVTDLRGRVARCDASIARLSSDLKACYDSVKAVSQTHADDCGKLNGKTSQNDQRIQDLYSRLERMVAENSGAMQRLETDVGRQLNSTDARVRSLVDELKGRMTADRGLNHSEREKLETRILNSMDRALAARDSKTAEFEKKTDDLLRIQQERIKQLEGELAKERERNAQAYKALETRISTVLESHITKQSDSMRRLKEECRDGFATVHDSLKSSNMVTEGKRKVLEEQLRKEIGQIRKMVVLI